MNILKVRNGGLHVIVYLQSATLYISDTTKSKMFAVNNPLSLPVIIWDKNTFSLGKTSCWWVFQYCLFQGKRCHWRSPIRSCCASTLRAANRLKAFILSTKVTLSNGHRWCYYNIELACYYNVVFGWLYNIIFSW